ncbi:uncharacterized protein K452DRAFT_358185 [Aplosporella prunicola CBS 121167]|uniref:37S ribosomal protein S25, mitochondrial n=1 Tax=Aplosporella prunicola CBS 121167 TaxID=1176127 RepID=A0A6A6BGE6_9PEZI|nr:uncharacterized protein K452DRAFT_358185 [Aplosporella prunicola CBS 121167]KAF2142375.1 hypothetical protein K452DRAFT_358185 [Aplosporella prunicola CBS 121167]
MGRYNFAPARVHRAATELLQAGQMKTPPPWYDVLATIPPAEMLVRPVQRTYNHPLNKYAKRPSRMFQPQRLAYEEDTLRREFFKDHPWELARPRVILENDGKDGQDWDWSKIVQPGKKLDGESVVQRQRWLMHNQGLSKASAYDQARKEFYRHRHMEDIERRIAHEEALHTGAYFSKSPLEVGMELEDKQFEEWKKWALKEVDVLRQAQAAMYSGIDNGEVSLDTNDNVALDEALSEASDSVPASKQGQTARGGAAIHP